MRVLKVKLPRAITLNKPFLIAFAPRFIHGNDYWSWTTKFVELAGQPITLDYMSPRVVKPSGAVYGFRGSEGGMTGTEHIQAFGEGSHRWSLEGDYGGSAVTLSYQHGIVSSRTTLRHK